MNPDFTKISGQDIIPIKLKHKERYYQDLKNVEYSWTSRVDVMFSNIFFNEAIQLIINSMQLFERGYFDAAFYSLRQSLEISTIIVYFVDDSELNRKESLRKWKNQEKFPAQARMISELKERLGDFADIKEKMSSYFIEIDEVKNRLNKYVHKQGFDKFYVVRNSPLKRDKYKKEVLLKDFEFFLTKSIGAIAVFRLTIDPFPILLLDEEMYSRTRDLLTSAYSQKFIKKYIGAKNINNYKKTNFYRGHYEGLMSFEKMSPSVAGVIKDQFIDNEKIEEILSQKHLLSNYDFVAVMFIKLSPRIVRVYCIDGLHWYFTNADSDRKKMSWSSEDFTTSKVRVNTPYDGAYLTHFYVLGEDYFVEHNGMFAKKELGLLRRQISKLG